LIWKLVLNDSQFGADLFLKLAHEYRHDNAFRSALTETQRGDLYTWLKETYPGRQDPHPALNDSVRYLGQSGEHILTRSFTARDPKRAAG
jgi:hypothetical protein